MQGPAAPPAPEAPPPRNLAVRLFNLIAFLIGGIALAWLLRNQSWADLSDQLARLSGWFGALLVLELASLLCDAAALHAFMRPEARMISFWRVLGAQASGRAINVLTPGGALGEATKLTLLVPHAPRARVLSSILLLNLSQLYLSTTVMLLGVPLTLLLVDIPHPLKVAVGVGLAVLIPLMILLAVVIHRGAVATAVDALQRLRVISRERARAWRDHFVEVDRHIRELHRNRSAGTWKGLLWVLTSKLLAWAGAVTLLMAVGVPLTATMILGVLSFGVLLGWISNIVPLGLGVADGGSYVLYDLLGATGAQGLLGALLGRARTVVIAILGLGAMAALTIVDQLTEARRQHKLRALRARANHQRGGDGSP